MRCLFGDDVAGGGDEALNFGFVNDVEDARAECEEQE